MVPEQIFVVWSDARDPLTLIGAGNRSCHSCPREPAFSCSVFTLRTGAEPCEPLLRGNRGGEKYQLSIETTPALQQLERVGYF